MGRAKVIAIGPAGFMCGPKARPEPFRYIFKREGIYCAKCGGGFRSRRAVDEHWERKHASPQYDGGTERD
jgi:hypothetical protein